MAQFTDFIPQNVAFEDSKYIGVYNSNGVRVKQIALGSLAFPSNLGNKLYSFGALSDVHIAQETAESDFRRALSYFNEVGVDFVCISGDCTQYSQDYEWTLYNQIIAENGGGLPIYAVAGNHDGYGITVTDAFLQERIGYGAHYSFTSGNDVFIMLSNACWPSQSGNAPPFYKSSLQYLYELLEANRNKRCFVFQHYFMRGYAGDPANVYTGTTLFGDQETVIRSLMEHYPNSIWFHGHSHHTFDSQKADYLSNYDHLCGCHNIHVPSCYMPIRVSKNGEAYSRTELIDDSQGYVVDVYDSAIVLKGRDFETGEFLPISSYLLHTDLKTVTAGTYTDSTGTITP